MLNNSIFSLLLLENPNLLADIPILTMRSLLKLKEVPQSFIEWAASQSDREILLAIAQNPNTPTLYCEHLAQDANRIVRAAAKANFNL